jgi:hypothetical protein
MQNSLGKSGRSRLSWAEYGAARGCPCRSRACTRGGVGNGIAHQPAVPGLAPGACMRASADKGSQSCAARHLRRTSPQRKRNPVRRGICSIQAPSASWGTATWHTDRTRARLKRDRLHGPAWLAWLKRHGRRGGFCSRSPRARARGLYELLIAAPHGMARMAGAIGGVARGTYRPLTGAQQTPCRLPRITPSAAGRPRPPSGRTPRSRDGPSGPPRARTGSCGRRRGDRAPATDPRS